MKTYTPEQYKKEFGNDKFNSIMESVGIPTAIKTGNTSLFAKITEPFRTKFTERVSKASTAQEQAISGKQSLASGVLQTIGQGAGFVQDVATTVAQPVAEQFSKSMPFIKAVEKAGTKIINVLPVEEAVQKYNTWKQSNPEAAANLEASVNIASLIPIGAGSATASKTTSQVAKGTSKAVSDVVKPVVDVTTKPVTKTIDAIDDLVTKITAPDISDATRLSLNPVASKELAPEFKVSVGGKLKPISEITPTENSKLKVSTEKSLNFFQKQAEKFKNERNPLNDPTEIVGQRIDKALAFADKKRQTIGKKMGDIEQKYADSKLPLSEKTTNNFIETLKDFDNPRFGADAGDAVVVRKLVSDFDNISKAGAKVGDRLEFIRSWERYLKDAKDGFGNFKENATVNTRIQNAVVALKNETVDAITRTDKTYRKLRNQYRLFKELDETGNRLLGKEGMLGDRIKGGPTVKRAIKSNSDAGARQFLIKLKEITGYDALRDGDIALTAMDLVGDFQGLSLLEVLSEGRGGVLRKIGEKAQDVIAGGKEERIRKFIKK